MIVAVEHVVLLLLINRELIENKTSTSDDAVRYFCSVVLSSIMRW